MTEKQHDDQPDTERPEVTEMEAEEQTPESRQERRDGHIREQLRQVETERDMLQTRLNNRDRAAVETMAKAVLGERGAGLFTFDVAALRNEDGDLDADLVAEALEPIKAALEEGRIVHHGDMGVKRTAKPPAPSWQQIMAKSR